MADQLKRPHILTSVWMKNPSKAPIPTPHEVWDHNLLGIRVISTIEYTGKDRGEEWHLSISEKGGKYPSDWAIQKVRQDFLVEAFEQDDHGSKVAHLWMPIDKDKRGDCDCKE